MTILACHPSKRGGTQGIAETIADALRNPERIRQWAGQMRGELGG